MPEKPQQDVISTNNTGNTVPKWAPLALLLLTALLYSRSLLNGLTSYDDESYIINNPLIRDLSFDGIRALFTTYHAGNYHPLTMLVYMLLYKAFGAAALPYHLLSQVLHLLNTWLVYRLAKRLSRQDVTAIVTALLFAIHPMHVESVAWASELKDVLYAAFYLGAALCYLDYTGSGKVKYLAYSCVLFLASLLCKPAAVSLPVLLLAIDLYIGRDISIKTILEKAPLFLAALLLGIVAIYAQDAGAAITDLTTAYGLMNRVFLVSYGIAAYLVLAVVPVCLTAIHFFPGLTDGALPWYYYGSLPFLLGIAWLIIRRSAYRRELVFGFSFFLITIAAMLQVVAVGSAVIAERYTYIAYIGLFYIAGQYLETLQHKRNVLLMVLIPASIIYTTLSWVRIGVWQNDTTLYGDIIKKDPAHARELSRAFMERGNALLGEGNTQSALGDYNQAILFDRSVAEAFTNRGFIYSRLGDTAAALKDYTRALALDPRQAAAYNNRATLYYMSGNYTAAISDYTAAIAINNAYTDAYTNRGWAYYHSGNKEAAIKDHTKVIALNPESASAFYNLAAGKANDGDLQAALEYYNYFLLLQPNDPMAYNDRGFVHINMKNVNAACEDWHKAVQLGNTKAKEAIDKFCK